MNKKLIAIAVASVMAAPVAMADMKISGRVAQDFTILDTDNPAVEDARGFSDSGHARLQFDGTQGNAYARIARDARLNKALGNRDQYVGYKFGGGMSVQAGRMGGVAKNIEKDPYIATFLQTRTTVAESATSKEYGSSSFVDDVVQLKMKAGAANVAVQFGPADNAGSNNGHIGVAVTGKGGPVRYWASYNNAEADGSGALTTSQSNIKVGAAMKFGMATVSLNYTSMDTDGAAATAGVATDSIAVDGNFNLGNGMSATVGVAVRSGNVAADDAEFIRLAVMKKLNKSASVYGGYTTTDYDAAGDDDTSQVGVGMLVKF